jgi:AcrR family transcriptional regulator
MTDQKASAPARKRNHTKGARTRARLMVVGREVFEELGFLDTRIADIASAAGIAVGTFYTYFDSKEQLFMEIVQEFFESMVPVSLGEAGEDPLEHIRTSHKGYIDFYRANSKMLGLVESVSSIIPQVREMRGEKRRANVLINSRAIERLQAEGAVSKDLDPYMTASALQSMVSNFTYFWLVIGEDFKPAQVVKHLTMLWARVLGLDPNARPGLTSR